MHTLKTGRTRSSQHVSDNNEGTANGGERVKPESQNKSTGWKRKRDESKRIERLQIEFRTASSSNQDMGLVLSDSGPPAALTAGDEGPCTCRLAPLVLSKRQALSNHRRSQSLQASHAKSRHANFAKCYRRYNCLCDYFGDQTPIAKTYNQ